MSRAFKIVKINNKDVNRGRYTTNSSPSSVAKKVFSKLYGKMKNTLTSFMIKETTQGSKKKIYGPYKGKRIKLKKPRMVKFKGTNKPVPIRYETKIYKVKGKKGNKKIQKGGNFSQELRTTVKTRRKARRRDAGTGYISNGVLPPDGGDTFEVRLGPLKEDTAVGILPFKVFDNKGNGYLVINYVVIDSALYNQMKNSDLLGREITKNDGDDYSEDEQRVYLTCDRLRLISIKANNQPTINLGIDNLRNITTVYQKFREYKNLDGFALEFEFSKDYKDYWYI